MTVSEVTRPSGPTRTRMTTSPWMFSLIAMSGYRASTFAISTGLVTTSAGGSPGGGAATGLGSPAASKLRFGSCPGVRRDSAPGSLPPWGRRRAPGAPQPGAVGRGRHAASRRVRECRVPVRAWARWLVAPPIGLRADPALRLYDCTRRGHSTKDLLRSDERTSPLCKAAGKIGYSAEASYSAGGGAHASDAIYSPGMASRGYRGRFATTRWSLVLAASHRSSPEAQEALTALFEAYWYPLYGYLRGRGYSADQAQDLTQSFFTVVLEKQVLRAADPSRGRFRSFLLTALKNFACSSVTIESPRARCRGRIVARA
jgi:hypothetical protein